MVFSTVISGIGAGLFSIGGPLLALYFNQIFDNREEHIGNLQFTFVICGTISFVTRIINGIYTADLIKYTIVGVVFIYLGQFIGNKIAGALKPRIIRIIIYILVLFAGIMTLIKYI